MRPQYIMFLGFVMMSGLLISYTFAGGWFGASDLSSINAIAGFKSATILGTWSIQVPNIDFITTGIASLLKFDFAFFDGAMGLMKWFMIATIGAGAVWGIFTVVIYTISGLFPRR